MSIQRGWWTVLLCLAGCVSSRPDRFYVLEPVPRAESVSRSSFALETSLRVTPSACIGTFRKMRSCSFSEETRMSILLAGNTMLVPAVRYTFLRAPA